MGAFQHSARETDIRRRPCRKATQNHDIASQSIHPRSTNHGFSENCVAFSGRQQYKQGRKGSLACQKATQNRDIAS